MWPNALFGSAEQQDNGGQSLLRRVLYGVGFGLLAAFTAVFGLLVFWASHSPGFVVAIPISLTVVGLALVTGPVAVLHLLMGVRGSYYAFLSITLFVVFAAGVYVQVKYLPARLWPVLAAVDVFVLFFLLWAAQLLI